MTSQQRADALLAAWQLQRAAGIPANDRRLPEQDAEFERDIEILRRLMARGR